MLLAVCQEWGLDTGGVIPQIAYGFAGGIGSTGSVCGAVGGGVMAISLKLGRGQTMAEGLAKLSVVQESRRRFEGERGSINCRELTGMDLATREGRMQYMASAVPQQVCFPAVGTAYRLVLDMVTVTPPQTGDRGGNARQLVGAATG